MRVFTSSSGPDVRQCELDLPATPVTVCGALRRPGEPALLLDGGPGPSGWSAGPLLALEPRVCLAADVATPAEADRALRGLDALVRERRAAGGTRETGLAALLAYDLLDPVHDSPQASPALPRLLVLEVNASVRLPAARDVAGTGPAPVELPRRPSPGGRTDSGLRIEHARRCRLTLRGRASAGDVQREADALCRRLAVAQPTQRDPVGAGASRPRTSLPRDAYLFAVERVQRHIERGDIYQGNLCQQFRTAFDGDALDLYRTLQSSAAGPHSAYLCTPSSALVSVSPESFVRITPPDCIETWPIKGTRPRGATPAEDRRASTELMQSPKDRAELLMIVDLERNDLGRICRTGTVHVPELVRLQTFRTVHHLIAHIRGTLRPDVGVDALLRAVFPGGSITGAPKLRAMQILRSLEPVRRGSFTGSLVWFGDDGGLDSSILIRSIEISAGCARIGAGGGIVADSEPGAEWSESNHKARALTRALGFEPEEAR